MLNQLIESRNHAGEARRRGGFFLTTFAAVACFFTLGLIYSLFSHNLAMASDALDLSTLTAPIVETAAADEPQPERPNPKPKTATVAETIDQPVVRVKNIQDTSESPLKPPDGVSVEKNSNLSRPQERIEFGTRDTPAGSSSGGNPTGRGTGDANSVGIGGTKPANEEIETASPPPIVKKPETKLEPSLPSKQIVKSEGVINGKATNLVKPTYPVPARQVRAQGAVNVQVLIDEEGNVVKANAVSGHQLLRQAAEQAARASKFSPTFLSRQKVKVTGVIVYNFVAQ